MLQMGVEQLLDDPGNGQTGRLHVQIFSAEVPQIKEMNEANKRYTLEKWKGGIPFDGNLQAFELHRKPYVTGDMYYEVVDHKNLKNEIVRQRVTA